jgi:hypothetical protein
MSTPRIERQIRNLALGHPASQLDEPSKVLAGRPDLGHGLVRHPTDHPARLADRAGEQVAGLAREAQHLGPGLAGPSAQRPAQRPQAVADRSAPVPDVADLRTGSLGQRPASSGEEPDAVGGESWR